MNWTKWQIATLYKMRDEGHTYAEIGHRIGKSPTACKRYASRDRSCRFGRDYNYKQTICWGCINAVPNPETGAGCSWSRNLVPVEGWEAEGTRLLSYANLDPREFTSYRVIKCPEYIEG